MDSFVCIEIGGSGAQTVVLDANPSTIAPRSVRAGIDVPSEDYVITVAVPGLVKDGRVEEASTLGWIDADPAEILDLPFEPAMVRNDAEAAALGEWVLGTGGGAPIVYVGLGTGIGAAVVDEGEIVAGNLLAHSGGGYGPMRCVCGAVGCLETVAAGWALPAPLSMQVVEDVAQNLGKAIKDESLAEGCVVVLAGGMLDRNPALLDSLAHILGGDVVVPSERPAGLKSAAAWGLRALFQATNR